MIAAVLPDIGRSLREAFFMFWETLWPLVLGFGLSGAVQAFVSRPQMERRLGDHRPGALARATVFGMASSSCSYAASAMAKSMFQKGADFISATVFMVASTNLVIELGVVLVVLLGWQFVAAEFIGGPIMIVMLAGSAALVLSPKLIESARRRLASASGMGAAGVTDAVAGEERSPEHDGESWRVKLGSRAAWADAASFTIADLKMLRRELAIGYLVAGFLATFVPAWLWSALFVRGHGGWTTLENAVIGPVVAFASFVCSIGNVPMAAALWKGGIAFGGVVSFIFADLVAAPLVLVYRRYYGWRLTLRLVGLFWAVMAGAGLIVGEIFSGAGIIPRHRPTVIAPIAFHWNYTSVLNIIFLALFAYLYWLYRNRERLGGGTDTALDPVCGMQVHKASAPASAMVGGRQYWFCSDGCADHFVASATGAGPSSGAG